MSVVERAIRKLQGAASGKKVSSGETPVAQAVVESAIASPPPGAAPQSSADGRDTGRFDAAVAGRSINFDFAALAAAGLLAPGNERLADEYRAIKQPILRKAGDRTADGSAIDRLIMVSSALSGEGKTFTSVNLSLSLAREHDWSVLLVDTDCRNPSLSRLLGVADQPGLLDFLRPGNAGLESFVLPTNVERLYVLPLGQSDPHAAELLASEKMQSVCAALAAGEYGQLIVLFDSSPLLLTPEPVILGAHVGQILLVVQADQTARPAVADALAKLDPGKTIGLVLNRASATEVMGSYTYGYSYDRYKAVG
jgi:receptor protein-tyrosine kinase